MLTLIIVAAVAPTAFFFGYITALRQPYPEDMYDETKIENNEEIIK